MVLHLFKGVVNLPTQRCSSYIKCFLLHLFEPLSSRIKIQRPNHPSRSRPFINSGIRLQEESPWVWTRHSKRNCRSNDITLLVNMVASKPVIGPKSRFCVIEPATRARSMASRVIPACRCRLWSINAISHVPIVGENRTWTH